MADVLDIDFSGTCDATGTTSISQVPSPAYWVVLKVIAQTTGSAIWTVLVNGRAVTFGRGARVDLGPIVLQPRDQLTILVQSAVSGAAVSGKFLGSTAATVQEIMDHWNPAPNTIALDTASPTILLGSVVDPNGAGTSTIFQLPPGTQAVGFNWDLTGPNNAPATVVLIGLPSLTTYLTVHPSLLGLASGGLEVAPIATGVDTRLSVSVTSPGAGQQSTVYVMAWMDEPAVFVRVVDGTQLPVSLTSASAAPWQAARSITAGRNGALAGGATAPVIAGVAGQKIYLFSITCYTETAAGAFVDFEDTVGPNVVGRGTTNVPNQAFKQEYFGAPLPGGAGAGLNIKNFGGAAEALNWAVAYTQAP